MQVIKDMHRLIGKQPFKYNQVSHIKIQIIKYLLNRFSLISLDQVGRHLLPLGDSTTCLQGQVLRANSFFKRITQESNHYTLLFCYSIRDNISIGRLVVQRTFNI